MCRAFCASRAFTPIPPKSSGFATRGTTFARHTRFTAGFASGPTKAGRRNRARSSRRWARSADQPTARRARPVRAQFRQNIVDPQAAASDNDVTGVIIRRGQGSRMTALRDLKPVVARAGRPLYLLVKDALRSAIDT